MTKVRPPSKLAILKELSAIKDVLSLALPRTKIKPVKNISRPKHIVMLPGFGTDSRYFLPLQKFLQNHGHHTYDWGLGINDAGLKRKFSIEDLRDSWAPDDSGKSTPIHRKEIGVPYLCSIATDKVESLANSIDNQLVLIGWSLGGYIAREVARELPQQVSQVITFGTPVVGGPKYTSVAHKFRNAGVDVDWIEREILKRDSTPITQTITTIIGKHDGIVHKSASFDTINPNVHTHIVNASHIGLGFHYPTWKIVLQALQN